MATDTIERLRARVERVVDEYRKLREGGRNRVAFENDGGSGPAPELERALDELAGCAP